MSDPDVVVIGAGAAGIIAAWRAATLGAKVLLLEKNDRIGIKILVSGGGKCNITHDGPLEEVLRAFRPNEARFIRPACYRFTNRQIVDMLTSRGLEVYTRPDGRIFPVHQTARDVVQILSDYLSRARVEVKLSSPVTSIERREDDGFIVRFGQSTVVAKRLVVAVGGASYPKTGTTGDGYGWMKELGHTVAKIRPALAPMYLQIDADWSDRRSGVALRNVTLKARAGKEIARWTGDLLFTHQGVSGPNALGISRVVAERMQDGPVSLEVDLLPDTTFEELSGGWQTFASRNPTKQVSSWLEGKLPQRLECDLLKDAGVEAGTIVSQLSAKARNRLIEMIKGWPLGFVRAVPLERGEVVAGGVSLDEVDPKSMRSLRCPQLYLCGEILDIAGPVGGYNLQAAFATGYVAGDSAASDALAQRKI